MMFMGEREKLEAGKEVGRGPAEVRRLYYI